MKAELEREIKELEAEHGAFFYDVPLPHGVWTIGKQVPHTRLKRITQIIADLGGTLEGKRILDLGCLEGQFAIEMALQGAEAVGIEIREANIEKAQFLKRALNLPNVSFYGDDVRNISPDKYGRFDAIICSGILYHLPAEDVIALIARMREMARLVVIDTHIALKPKRRFGSHWGKVFSEHGRRASAAEKAKKRWASADNATSFWFTRPSLINILTQAGFSSVYECFAPAHMNYGETGVESIDRCTFVAVNSEPIELRTSPAANGLVETWPEGTLTYSMAPVRRLIHKIRRRL